MFIVNQWGGVVKTKRTGPKYLSLSLSNAGSRVVFGTREVIYSSLFQLSHTPPNPTYQAAESDDDKFWQNISTSVITHKTKIHSPTSLLQLKTPTPYIDEAHI